MNFPRSLNRGVAVVALAACVLTACGGGDLDEPSTLDRMAIEAQEARSGHATPVAPARLAAASMARAQVD
jgi:hypothetical protein